MAMHRVLWTAAWLAALALVSVERGAAADARFTAALANGQRLAGNNLHEWHDSNARPHLDGQRLLEEGNPLRWLRDRQTPLPDPPAAYVETINGDRLPGVVIDAATGDEDPFQPWPPHLVVRPTCALSSPRGEGESAIRVATRFVRRIVFAERRPTPYQPAWAFYRDGRSFAFRQARFGAGYVSLLTDDGPRRLLFGELAEIHLPAADPWSAHFDELAILTPQLTGRLLQVETRDGLLATASTERLRIIGHGGGGSYDRWVHGLQPAWSLDVLWVPNGQIAVRRMFAPHEAPLVRLPATVEAAATLAPRAIARVNRNARGGPLRSGGEEYGYGFGVHGSVQLRFPLTAAAAGFSTRVGLDQTAGRGGSVQARIEIAGAQPKRLYESPVLVGSAQVVDSGALSLAGAGASSELVLVIDDAHARRPPGADPFDVRDWADWLDPLLTLDREAVEREVRSRAPAQVAAWRGWEFSQDPGGRLELTNYWHEMSQGDGVYVLLAAAHEQPLRLTRSVRLASSDRWLIAAAARRQHGGQPVKIEVRIGGEAAAGLEAPVRDGGNPDPRPLATPLDAYHAAAPRTLPIEIVQHPQPEGRPVEWRALCLVEQLPMLYRLFEDDGDWRTLAGGPAELQSGIRHAGQRALQLAAPGQASLQLATPAAIRERPAWGEYRYLRIAFRKQGQGRLGFELGTSEARERPVRYDAGAGPPVLPDALRVWQNDLPDEWIVLTRDLYNEYGHFDVAELIVEAPDGAMAWVDHVYLARSDRDFELLLAPAPEVVNQAARRELTKHILQRAGPATVAIDFGDGRLGGGVVVDNEARILTAGHLAGSPGREVQVHTADGRTAPAITLGVHREFNLALVQVTDEARREQGPWPHTDIAWDDNIPPAQLYVGLVYGKQPPRPPQPQAHVATLLRDYDGVLWTDLEPDDWSAGGGLFDREGRVVGVLSGRGPYGGLQYIRAIEARRAYERLKQREVWGAWRPGAGPMIGMTIRTTSDGCRVLEVHADSPAAAAGVQVGDLVVAVDGRDVQSLGEIYALLAERNAGDEVKVTIDRGGQRSQITLRLAPRRP